MAISVVESGGTATDALRAAGIDAGGAWLAFHPETFSYAVAPERGVRMNAETTAEISRRAMRPGERGLRGVLSNGARVEITPPLDPEALRLAVICERALSDFEVELMALVAERCRSRLGSSPPAGLGDEAPGEARRVEDRRPAALVVDLRAFEDVRLAAGQLSAERVTADACARVAAQLRDGDELVRLGEDSFGVIVQVSDERELHAVGGRIGETLTEVPVPRRASPIRADVRYPSVAELAADPALSPLLDRFGSSSTTRRAA